MMKEKIYDFIANTGMKFLLKFFPEYFAKEPVKPTDRFIEYPFIFRNLPKPPAKILDVGCAGSYFPLILSSLGYDVWGVDIREYAILKCITFNNFRFIKEDITKCSSQNNFFDIITAISTVEHIGLGGRYGNYEDNIADHKALVEMKRILKPGGSILLTVPYGKPTVLEPYCKIYDKQGILRLTDGLHIEREEYARLDSRGDWYMCSEQDAAKVNCSPGYYALGLFRIEK